MLRVEHEVTFLMVLILFVLKRTQDRNQNDELKKINAWPTRRPSFIALQDARSSAGRFGTNREELGRGSGTTNYHPLAGVAQSLLLSRGRRDAINNESLTIAIQDDKLAICQSMNFSEKKESLK